MNRDFKLFNIYLKAVELLDLYLI